MDKNPVEIRFIGNLKSATHPVGWSVVLFENLELIGILFGCILNKNVINNDKLAYLANYCMSIEFYSMLVLFVLFAILLWLK